MRHVSSLTRWLFFNNPLIRIVPVLQTLQKSHLTSRLIFCGSVNTQRMESAICKEFSQPCNHFFFLFQEFLLSFPSHLRSLNKTLQSFIRKYSIYHLQSFLGHCSTYHLSFILCPSKENPETKNDLTCIKMDLWDILWCSKVVHYQINLSLLKRKKNVYTNK